MTVSRDVETAIPGKPIYKSWDSRFAIHRGERIAGPTPRWRWHVLEQGELVNTFDDLEVARRVVRESGLKRRLAH